MEIVETVGLAFSLGLDAFAVALGIGGRGATGRQAFRLSFHFGLFQFFMPLLGWVLGQGVLGALGSYDRWVAFGVLLAVGLNMLVGAFRRGEDGRGWGAVGDPTRGLSLIGLSVATSLDALGVGVGLGVLGRYVLGSAVVIGIVAAAMTLVGLRMGGFLRRRAGDRMEALGGVVLVLLAVKILFS